MQTVQAVKMAAKLYECRDAAKHMFGSNYQERMKAYGQVVKSAANSMGCSELSAATELANKVGGIAAVLYLAAVVEMTEPPNAELTGASGDFAAKRPR